MHEIFPFFLIAVVFVTAPKHLMSSLATEWLMMATMANIQELLPDALSRVPDIKSKWINELFMKSFLFFLFRSVPVQWFSKTVTDKRFKSRGTALESVLKTCNAPGLVIDVVEKN